MLFCRKVKPYLAYRIFIKIHNEDIKENIKFPQSIKPRNYALTQDDIKKIVDYSSHKRRAFYLFLSSTGMRIREACQLRKRDFDQGLERYKITIPAKYTKTKTERTAFMSKESEKYVKPILDKIGPDSLVFGVNEDPMKSVLAEEMYFMRVRKNTGLIDKYETGVSKITIHTFRSFFISKCEKIHEGLGHALAGHDRYMQQYERFTDDELLEFYLKAEPHLGIYSQALKEVGKEMEEKIREFENLREEFKSDHIIVEEIQRLFGLSGQRLVIPNGNPNEMRFEEIDPLSKSNKQDKPLVTNSEEIFREMREKNSTNFFNVKNQSLS
ncbi:MAG: tyrosine-type recombinase/integrase, partial [Nitrososphaeraceae archaeon]